MNKICYTLPALLLLLSTFCFVSCDDDDSYADKKERERKSINSFIKTGTTVITDDGDTLLHVDPITTITEAEFAAQDSTTDLDRNEYVLLSSTGIYMQIINQGSGEILESGETMRVLTRFIEFNIQGDSVQLLNNNTYYIAVPDEMYVANSSGTLSGSFLSGVMYTYYGTSVPEGWLMPLKYVKVGRGDETGSAKVRVIVPHSSGTTTASTSVYPCFYELSFTKGR